MDLNKKDFKMLQEKKYNKCLKIKAASVFRLGSAVSSDVSNDTSTNHAESYFLRRENRLSAKKKAEEEKMNSDYQKAGDALKVDLIYLLLCVI